mmetsp:Transcript_32212/g.38982  ORF Transcript_32212/g.38982 Transcript_32212/m.38982 type:complete len:160 (+) Transcript_32212:177-656(+)|eukprot:CAMPEP_0197853582 /NCGR_PEP_ID=MMETSP1438-20131217/23006_1 /TAXON_ID=1461541 /ORGANISM="Pterosperma sp., Strain CCMP1384" /LENGTH=159 /DNA_ID=CAMNT_0043468049 /DNA_START=172 /DNA_END=651 /DNA_ORIENTATION=-
MSFNCALNKPVIQERDIVYAPAPSAGSAGTPQAAPLYPAVAASHAKFAPNKQKLVNQKRVEAHAERGQNGNVNIPSWSNEPESAVKGGHWVEIEKNRSGPMAPKPHVNPGMNERKMAVKAYVAGGEAPAGITSSDYERQYGYSNTGLKLVKDGWGRSVH